MWVHDQARLVLDDDGRPVYWQGVLIDVTEQRRTQELERDLERERLEAERLRAEDEMKTTFLQAVSHDLRTPLAAILGLAVTMERDDIDLTDRGDARHVGPHRAERSEARPDRLGLPRPRADEPGHRGAALRTAGHRRTGAGDRRELRPGHGPAPGARRRPDHREGRRGDDRTDRREPARQHREAHAGRFADLGPRRALERRRSCSRSRTTAPACRPRSVLASSNRSGKAPAPPPGRASVSRSLPGSPSCTTAARGSQDRVGGGASFRVLLATDPTGRPSSLDLTGFEDDQATDATSSEESQA